MPVAIQNNLESIMKRFLWKGDASNRAFCKVSWNSICNDYKNGGLGIFKLRTRNQSLLFKWVLKVRLNSPDSLWSSVVFTSSQIKDWNSLTSLSPPNHSFIWKGIRSICCLDIQDLFPRIFNLSRRKDACFSDFIRLPFIWRRRLRLNEKDDFDSLLSYLNMVVLSSLPDGIRWLKENGVFSAASYCHLSRKVLNSDHRFQPLETASNNTLLDVSSVYGNVRSAPFSVLLTSISPPRILFIVWLGFHDRVSSLLLLNSINIIAANQVLCSLSLIPESQDHILLHCSFATSVWNKILRMLGISFVMPKSLVCFFNLWRSFGKFGYSKKRWQCFWEVTIWEIWKFRNRRIYENKCSEVDDIVFHSFLLTGFYIKCKMPGFSYSGLDLCRNPDLRAVSRFFQLSCINYAELV
ncbi:uncharacterized protein LOC126664959 [Mercurialis annua]|uniref:uncharacterized protein LOC126664959 n=1 Tax=Mercurialis annua TaxID=3986 RepID=UPI00215F89DF|nr:uncharacterized protein LOC126664959 [Mercurialis annua]